MKKNNDETHEFATRFLFNKDGKQLGVFLSNKALEEFLEKLEDYYFGQLADFLFQSETEFVSHEDVKKMLAKEVK